MWVIGGDTMYVDSISPLGVGATDYSWITNSVNGTNDATNIFNTINGVNGTGNVINTLQALYESRYQSADDVRFDPQVNFWFQYPNDILRIKALTIVGDAKTDDEKVERIQEWVVNNIEYTSDKVQWGYDELWQPPMMTLSTGKGDCEDGAFLIMGLALNAGVDPDRLRFYGGYVNAGPGAAEGGHGWVAYKREMDDVWVVADYSYYPDLRAMDLRTPMSEDTKYVEQWFMMEVSEFITSDTNRVREPDVRYNNRGYYTQPNVLLPNSYSTYA